MRKLIYPLALLFLIILPVKGQNNESLKQLLHQRTSFLADSFAIPGMSVSVIQHGEIIFKKSMGLSNLEYGIPMTDTSLYRIWSVSKQFAAVSILKLREEGKLTLDDRIGSYLDTIPEQWEKVLIRNLMNQTGGIKDYLNDYPEGQKLTATPYEVVRDSTSELKFPPGMGWSYTNTGYWVMTKIVESLTGLPYQQYIEQNFFKPSGMELTRKMDYYAIIPGRVSGYRVVDGIPYNSTRMLDEGFTANGDAELLSNLEDLISWTQYLLSEEAIGRESLELAWKPTYLDNGDSIDASYLIFYDDQAGYGMGWFLSELDGHRMAWTPGAGRGFSTTITTLPDDGLSIVVLTNTRRFLVADRIARHLALVVLDYRE
jgi:CubicO group peptidase (beta-lactamase class C family)